MSLEAGLFGYAALASLAMGRKKYRLTPPSPSMGSPSLERGIGLLLLLLSAMAAILRFGPQIGAVAWTGQICVAAAALVLLLSWRPRVAVMMKIPALIGAVMLTTSGAG